MYSVTRAPNLLTSIGSDLDNGLSRLVTTSELIWVDPRFHIKPVLAWKHEREYDRTLSSHSVGIGGSTWRKFFEGWHYSTYKAKWTVLSSRNNALLSVYDVSSNKNGLLQSHALPYSLSGRFSNEPHAGFHVVHPHPESDNTTTASLVQLSSRGGIYQSAIALEQEKDTTSLPIGVDVSWSSAVHRLATNCTIQQPDISKLGARAKQEIDFRQAYQRISSLMSGLCSHIAQKFLYLSIRALFPTRRHRGCLSRRKCRRCLPNAGYDAVILAGSQYC